MIPEVTISREIKVNLFMLAATEGSKIWSFDIGINVDLDKIGRSYYHGHWTERESSFKLDLEYIKGRGFY